MKSLLDGWLAEGKKTLEFERKFSKYIGQRSTVLVNSGSSALLLIFAALMNKAIKNPLKKGDEVITSALTFPTTLNAIILNSLIPVFVDVELYTYNMNPDLIEKMISKKTKAILVLHHLGNPCNMKRIVEIAEKNNLYVIEDCCDAHGAEFNGKKLGSFGDMATFSFYCAHAMTMGEGGAVVCKEHIYDMLLRSLKTCGRACICEICEYSINPDYQCNIRFISHIKGYEKYDKRTLYTSIGYKMKILDLQAAFGLEQLNKLDYFVNKRTENFNYITNHLKKYNKFIMLPKVIENAKPSWFSIPLTVKKDSPFKREHLVNFLEKNNIETRPLLGGNIIKQPAYYNLKYRATNLKNTNFFHDNSFYIGCYPGITEDMRSFICSCFDSFFKQHETKTN